MEKIKLTNKKGEYAEILPFGATIYSLNVNDKMGKLRDIVLGFDSEEEYFASGTCFGAVVGRVANRISGSKFSLNGKEYRLFDNTGDNVTLHGGKVGFHKKSWSASKISDSKAAFTLFSEDGDENFPGNLNVKVTYEFTDDSELKIHYEAEADSDTILNLTNHSYFNLDGHDCGHNIYNTFLKLNSDTTTPLGTNFTPTGDFVNVKNTPYDFTEFKSIGKEIDTDDPQLKLAGGYDINYVKKSGNLVAEAYSENSGITLKCESDMPCVQLYVGNFIDNNTKGKKGAIYNRRHGFCLETQNYPNAVNTPVFPPITLKAGEKFSSETIYSFGIKN